MSVTTPTIAGAIPRIERQRSHHQFLWAVRPPAVMVGLTHARRIVSHDNTFFPPETDCILTSTISDDTLTNYNFADELRIIRALDPTYVLPFDFPVYGDMDEHQRHDNIIQSGAGSVDMYRIVSDSLSRQARQRLESIDGITRSLLTDDQQSRVIPLLKGTDENEWDQSYTIINNATTGLIAKYATQYMTIGGSGNYPALKDDLETIATQTGNHPLLVIGLLSPTGRYSLEHLPKTVHAAAGLNQWVKRVSPRSASPAEMRDSFAQLSAAVATALSVPDTYDKHAAAQTADTPPTELTTDTARAVDTEFTLTTAGAAGDPEYGFGGRKRPEHALGPEAAGFLS